MTYFCVWLQDLKPANWANLLGILALGCICRVYLHPVSPSGYSCGMNQSWWDFCLCRLAKAERSSVLRIDLYGGRTLQLMMMMMMLTMTLLATVCTKLTTVRDGTIRTPRQRPTLCLSVCLSVCPSVRIALRPANETLTTLCSSERLHTANRCYRFTRRRLHPEIYIAGRASARCVHAVMHWVIFSISIMGSG